MDNTEAKIKESKWIEQETVCNLIGIKLKTLKVHCRNGVYTYKVKKVNHKYIYYIHFQLLCQYRSVNFFIYKSLQKHKSVV